jgi:CubicO group peptidase (beta-lactamase class C family)
LTAIEKALDAKRAEYGIPGCSLAIIEDDKVVLLKGYGLRDVANRKPVTPDTLFAIGSATKAFTAMSVMMLQDDGKLSLTDSPKKVLPYFKLRDPDADTKITLRDMMCHDSGLPRTDIYWAGNRLNREEAIRVLADVKPTAKLGERFQYQNVMFAATGEIAARTAGMSYEKLIQKRILDPLGMKNTTLDVKRMQRSPDFSVGYEPNPKQPGTKALPMRNLPAIAPAGAINSSARDMVNWVRLMLDGGQWEGKRLVSETGYAQLIKPQMSMGPKMAYGLGWFLHPWHDIPTVEHGGNIDGFNAEIGFMPDKHIGFVLLTNVSASPLASDIQNIVWSNLVDVPEDSKPAIAVDPDIEKKTIADMVGDYYFEKAPNALTMSIKDANGKTSLVVAGQPPYPVALRDKEIFGSPALPADFTGTIHRTADGKVSGFLWKQPGFEGEMKRKPDTEAVVDPTLPTVETLIPRMIDALGGETALRRHMTLYAESASAMENQGITGTTKTWVRVPNAKANESRLFVLGNKQVAYAFDYFDGEKGGTQSDLGSETTLEDSSLDFTRMASYLHPLLDARSLIKEMKITGKETVNGEETVIVEFVPQKGLPFREYVSMKSFLTLRRDIQEPLPQAAGGGAIPLTQFYGDYRDIDGEKIPFTVTTKHPLYGDIVETVKVVKFNEKMNDSEFHRRK